MATSSIIPTIWPMSAVLFDSLRTSPAVVLEREAASSAEPRCSSTACAMSPMARRIWSAAAAASRTCREASPVSFATADNSCVVSPNCSSMRSAVADN